MAQECKETINLVFFNFMFEHMFPFFQNLKILQKSKPNLQVKLEKYLAHCILANFKKKFLKAFANILGSEKWADTFMGNNWGKEHS